MFSLDQGTHATCRKDYLTVTNLVRVQIQCILITNNLDHITRSSGEHFFEPFPTAPIQLRPTCTGLNLQSTPVNASTIDGYTISAQNDMNQKPRITALKTRSRRSK